MPTIADAAVTRVVSLPAGLAEPVAGSRPESPCVVEVVFAAGSLETGHFLAVNIEEIVPFAEPTVFAVSPTSPCQGNIRVPRDRRWCSRPGHRWVFLAVPGVEMGGVGRNLARLDPVHLPVQSGGTVGVVVGDRNPRHFETASAGNTSRAPVGDTCTGTLSTTAGLPWPTAKKSAKGASTAGSLLPSQ